MNALGNCQRCGEMRPCYCLPGTIDRATTLDRLRSQHRHTAVDIARDKLDRHMGAGVDYVRQLLRTDPNVRAVYDAAVRVIAGMVRETENARPFPTEDAYMAACRALHWRTAQLRANGIEPVEIPLNAPAYPPDGTFDATRPTPP